MADASGIAAWIDRTKEQISYTSGIVALALMVEVIARTPVRTGLARASWVLGAEFPELISTAPVVIPSLRVPQSPPAGKKHILANPLFYIVPLEHGHSPQAPPGHMVAGAIQYIQGVFGNGL